MNEQIRIRKMNGKGISSSAFRKWFKAQFDSRPNSRGMDEKFRQVVREGRWARAKLRAVKLYDREETDALYAWQAKDLDENEILKRLPDSV